MFLFSSRLYRYFKLKPFSLTFLHIIKMMHHTYNHFFLFFFYYYNIKLFSRHSRILILNFKIQFNIMYWWRLWIIKYGLCGSWLKEGSRKAFFRLSTFLFANLNIFSGDQIRKIAWWLKLKICGSTYSQFKWARVWFFVIIWFGSQMVFRTDTATKKRAR